MNILVQITIGLFMLTSTPQEITPRELAKKIEEKYRSHYSMSYDIDYRIKYFSSVDDTNQVNARVDLIRIPEDTIFGGYIWIQTGDSLARYYDTSNVYFISEPGKKITRYKKEEPWAITGNITGSVRRVFFLDPARLLSFTDDSTVTIRLTRIEINGKAAWHWVNDYTDQGDMSNQSLEFWVDPEDLSIFKIKFQVDFMGESQYNEWNLSNIEYDRVRPEDLSMRLADFQGKYSQEDFKPRTQEEQEPLPNGTMIPDVKGVLYRSGDSAALSDHFGKLMLIDFWYMDCFPCIKAIPHLNELYHRYAEKGFQVIGVDPFDNTEKNRKRLPDFLERTSLDYPILFVDREDVKRFKVFGYPTFYLVGRDGRIIYSDIGFSEELAPQLDSVIRANL